MIQIKPNWNGKKCKDCADHETCWILEKSGRDSFDDEPVARTACGLFKKKEPQKDTHAGSADTKGNA